MTPPATALRNYDAVELRRLDVAHHLPAQADYGEIRDLGGSRIITRAEGCQFWDIDGKAYFVDGTKIDDHGDAHAEDGFCEAIRKAEVQGKVVDGRFKATYFKLLPEPKAGQQ